MSLRSRLHAVNAVLLGAVATGTLAIGLMIVNRAADAAPIVSEVDEVRKASESISNWPATTVLGAVCIACLVLSYFMVKSYMKLAEQQVTAEKDRNAAVNALANELRGRPCIMNK